MLKKLFDNAPINLREITFQETLEVIEKGTDMKNLYFLKNSGGIAKVDDFGFSFQEIRERRFFIKTRFDNDGEPAMLITKTRYTQLLQIEQDMKRVEKQTGEVFDVLKIKVQNIWDTFSSVAYEAEKAAAKEIGGEENA